MYLCHTACMRRVHLVNRCLCCLYLLVISWYPGLFCLWSSKFSSWFCDEMLVIDGNSCFLGWISVRVHKSSASCSISNGSPALVFVPYFQGISSLSESSQSFDVLHYISIVIVFLILLFFNHSVFLSSMVFISFFLMPFDVTMIFELLILMFYFLSDSVFFSDIIVYQHMFYVLCF